MVVTVSTPLGDSEICVVLSAKYLRVGVGFVFRAMAVGVGLVVELPLETVNNLFRKLAILNLPVITNKIMITTIRPKTNDIILLKLFILLSYSSTEKMYHCRIL